MVRNIQCIRSKWRFIFNRIAFSYSLILLEYSRLPNQAENTDFFKDLRAGITNVTTTPWLWISIIIFSLTNVTLVGPYIVAMPFLVKDFMKADINSLGLILSTFPVGYVIGAVWLGNYKRLPRRGILMNLTLALAGAMLALYGLHLPLWMLIVAALINGIALEFSSLAWINLLQEKIPNEKLGRVSSIDQMGSLILMPVGLAVAGWATGLLGPAPVFLIGGSLTVLFAIAALTHPAIRNLD
jgi:MFS family permease